MSLLFACRAGSVAPTAGGGVSTAASLVAACKTRCAALLMLLGPLQPANGVAAAEHWLQQAGQVRECQQRCCLPPAWPAVRCHCACAIHTGFCCFWLQGGMPEEALSFLQGLLSDDSYTVRLAGTRLVQVGGWPCAVLLCLPCAAASCCAAAIAPRLAAAY